MGEEEEEWSKNAILFASFGRIGVKKSIAFSHNKDVLCSIDYTDSDILPEGTEKAIERYNITGVALFAKEMEAKNLTKPKVNLQFKLSSSGITRLIKAEATCEEMVMVDEQVEVDDDEEEKKENETIAINATGDASVDGTGDEGKDEEKAADKEESEGAKEKDDSAEDKESPEDKREETDSSETNEEAAETRDAKDETASSESKGGENATKDDEKKSDDKATDKDTKTKKRPPKKKKKFITVQKEKKRVHKKALTVKTYHVGRIQPYSESTLVAAKDKALQELEEMKNKLESYIYYIKNKLSDKEEEIAKVSTEEQRTALHELASSTEDWLYEDGYDVDLET